MIELITMLPLLGAPNIEKSPIYEYQIQTVVTEIQKEPEPINDPNKCEPAMYWAKEAPYYCIPKPTQRRSDSTFQASSTRTPVSAKTSTASSGWYPKYQCTWYVSTRRAVGQWNNASDWAWQAERDGYTVSTTPISGSIAWKYGHVAFVESVSGDTMVVSEANYDSRGSIRTIEVPVGSYSKFIY